MLTWILCFFSNVRYGSLKVCKMLISKLKCILREILNQNHLFRGELLPEITLKKSGLFSFKPKCIYLLDFERFKRKKLWCKTESYYICTKDKMYLIILKSLWTTWIIGFCSILLSLCIIKAKEGYLEITLR